MLQKYVIVIPECDNVGNPNACPGVNVNGCVIEPEVDLLLILIVESYFGQDSSIKRKVWPFKSTLNFEYSVLSIVLLYQVNTGSKRLKKGMAYFLPCINDDMALHLLNVCNMICISCPLLFLQSPLMCIVLNENGCDLRCMLWIFVKTCGKAEKDEAKSGNDESKGVPGRRGVTEGDGTM